MLGTVCSCSIRWTPDGPVACCTDPVRRRKLSFLVLQAIMQFLLFVLRQTNFIHEVLMRTSFCAFRKRQNYESDVITNTEGDLPAGSSDTLSWSGLATEKGLVQHNSLKVGCTIVSQAHSLQQDCVAR